MPVPDVKRKKEPDRRSSLLANGQTTESAQKARRANPGGTDNLGKRKTHVPEASSFTERRITLTPQTLGKKKKKKKTMMIIQKGKKTRTPLRLRD